MRGLCLLLLLMIVPFEALADPDDRVIGFDTLPGGGQTTPGAPLGEAFEAFGVIEGDTGAAIRLAALPPSERGSRPTALDSADGLRSGVVLRFVSEDQPHDMIGRQRAELHVLSLGRSRIEITAIDEDGEPVEGIDTVIFDATSGTLEIEGNGERIEGPSQSVDLLGLGYVDRATLEGTLFFGLRVQVTTQAPSDSIYLDDLTIVLDNCPSAPNEDQSDLDEDGFGDVCDDDLDGDNVPNEEDNCPTVENTDQADADDDGQGDACSPDPDMDGVPTDFNEDGETDRPCRTGQMDFCDDNCPRDANPDQRDGDEDGLGDVCDPDVDGDGFNNDIDTCPDTANNDQTDSDGDGQGDICDEDVDGDGVVNVRDNCPDLANPTQEDLDRDVQGDACDEDDDNDGIGDVRDNCPRIANGDQPDADMDGIGDECDVDGDNDDTPDELDNCPNAPNADQLDTDRDGEGDACDIDDDDDGLDDFSDNCVFVPNLDQSDLDGDLEGDACDDDVDGDSFANESDNCPGEFNPGQLDSDDDGVGDACTASQPLPPKKKGGCQQVAGHSNAPLPLGVLFAGLAIVGLRVRRNRGL